MAMLVITRWYIIYIYIINLPLWDTLIYGYIYIYIWINVADESYSSSCCFSLLRRAARQMGMGLEESSEKGAE